MLHYEPNLLARSLNTGVSKTIGLILPSISDSFYAHIADRIERDTMRAGYALMIASSHSEIERENTMIRLFRAKKVDGMIIAPTKVSPTEIERLAKDRYPVVLFDRYFPELPIDSVVIDNAQSSYRLVEHLIQRGRRRIAILTTNPHLLTMAMRHKGYVDALSDAGLQASPELYGEIPYVDYSEAIRRVLDRIFSVRPAVDALFFTTHILAIEAMRYFAEHGIAVDRDGLGLACMHEDRLLRLVAPRMNIAHFPVDAIGSQSVELLLQAIAMRRSPLPPAYTPKVNMVACQMEFRDE